MIHINESASHKPGTHDHYGPRFQAEVSIKTARALCGMYPLPTMGTEIVVGIALGARLYVANVGGIYFVRSPDVAIEDWPLEFRVTVKRKEA